MADFPTIAAPNIPIKITTDDPAIRTDAEGGYEMTRPRYTRIRKTFGLEWVALTNADYLLLKAHYEAMGGGSDMFNFTSPIDGSTVHVVRFNKPIDATLIQFDRLGNPKYWQVGIELKEV